MPRCSIVSSTLSGGSDIPGPSANMWTNFFHDTEIRSDDQPPSPRSVGPGSPGGAAAGHPTARRRAGHRRVVPVLRGARLGQVGGPLRIAVVGGSDQPPVCPARYRRHAAQAPAEFVDQPVGLAVVAAHAGGDAVLPGVRPAAAAWYHVIDGLGLDSAVRAEGVVPAHQRGSGQGHAAAMRHAYVAAEPDHRWGSQDDRGGTQYRSLRVVVNDLGLLA